MGNTFHDTKAMLGKLGFYREGRLRALIRITEVIEKKDFTETCFEVLALAYIGAVPEMPIGKIIRADENNRGEWNHVWTLQSLISENAEDAMKEIDPDARLLWKT